MNANEQIEVIAEAVRTFKAYSTDADRLLKEHCGLVPEGDGEAAHQEELDDFRDQLNDYEIEHDLVAGVLRRAKEDRSMTAKEIVKRLEAALE